MTSIAPSVKHVFKNIMDLDDDEIECVTFLQYDSWRKISRDLRHAQLKHHYENKDISMGVYKCFLDWLYYYTAYKPAQSNVMTMDNTIYDDVDMNALETSFRENSLSTTPSLPPAIMKTMAPAVHHLLSNILVLTDATIYDLAQLKYTTWTKVTRQLRLSSLNLELKYNCIDMYTYHRMKDWLSYYKTYLPTQNTVLSLDSTILPSIPPQPISTIQLHDISYPTPTTSHSLKCYTATRAIEPPSPQTSNHNQPTLTPIIHTTSAPPDTTNHNFTTQDQQTSSPIINTTCNTSPDDFSTATVDAFEQGFAEGYDNACDDFVQDNTDYNADAYSDNDDYGCDSTYGNDDDYGYDEYDDDGGYDDIDPEPPPY